MKVYLLRHGDYAISELTHTDSLTDKGQKEIKHLAHFLQQCNIKVATIYHSGKNRANQTAEIISAFLSNKHVEIYPNLSPMDDVGLFAQDLYHFTDDLLVVGHLPFLSRLVSKLLIDSDTKDIVEFKTGTLVVLERLNHSRFIIRWVLAPDLFAL